eukprot:SAG22_NODE_3_length_48349_cov_158.681180_9_plen_480_part_00
MCPAVQVWESFGVTRPGRARPALPVAAIGDRDAMPTPTPAPPAAAAAAGGGGWTGWGSPGEAEQARSALRSDGFFIVRGLVPQGLVAELSASVLAARDSYGALEISGTVQPRISVEQAADPDAAREIFEYCLRADGPLGVSRALTDGVDCALSQVQVLLNPEQEPAADEPVPPPGQPFGTDPRNWHRDIRPDHNGPLELLLKDEACNGIGYVQWNIALTPESCLQVVKGSHVRLTTPAEMAVLREDPQCDRLAGAVDVELQAGDGVCYVNLLLHHGRAYTPRLPRRTLHLAYRTFSQFAGFQRQHTFAWSRAPGGGAGGLPGLSRLSPPAAEQLKQMEDWQAAQHAQISALLRAAAAGDARGAEAALAALHPGEEGRGCALAIVALLARQVARGETILAGAVPGLPPGSRGADRLLQAFGPVLAQLELPPGSEPTHVRGFLGTPTRFRFERTADGAEPPVRSFLEHVRLLPAAVAPARL